MTSRARYTINEDDVDQAQPLVIEDVGPWDVFPTVTNDAEAVVTELHRAGNLPAGRRLFYLDSDGRRDELLVVDGKFAGFAAGERA